MPRKPDYASKINKYLINAENSIIHARELMEKLAETKHSNDDPTHRIKRKKKKAKK